MGLYTCIKKIYDKNGTIIQYHIKNKQTGNTQIVNSENLRDKLQSQPDLIDNLQVVSTKKGIQIRDKKTNENDEVINKYIESCNLLGIKPLTIEKRNSNYIITKIPTDTEVVIPKFVNGIELRQPIQGILPDASLPIKVQNTSVEPYNDKYIKSELYDIKRMLYALAGITRNGFTTFTDTLNNLSTLLEEQNQTLEDFIENGFKELPACFHEIIPKEKSNYPHCDTDLDDYMHYDTSCSDLFNLKPEQINKSLNLLNKGKCIGNITYPDSVLPIFELPTTSELSILFKHLEIVNNIRKQMDSAYEIDIKSNKYDSYNKDTQNLLGIFPDIGAFISLGCIDTATAGVGLTLNAVKLLGKTISTVGKSTIKNVTGGLIHDKDNTKLKNTRQTHVFGDVRQNTLYGRYFNISPDMIEEAVLNNPNISEAYAIDVRSFIINTKNLHYSKGIAESGDRTTDRYNEKTKYKKYTKNTLCRNKVTDEELFWFYCRYIIDRDAGMNQYNYDSVGDSIDTQGLVNKKFIVNGNNSILVYTTLFDCFTNAYFASKKYIISNSNGDINCLDFLKDFSDYADKQKYAKFIKLIKLCLLKQGISVIQADDMIRQFCSYNDAEKVINDYKNSVI